MRKHCPFHFLKNKHENKSRDPGYTLPSLCLHPEAPRPPASPPSAPSRTGAAHPELQPGPPGAAPPDAGQAPVASRISGSSVLREAFPSPASGSVEAETVPWSPVSPAPHQNSAGPQPGKRLLSKLVYTELPPHPGQKGFTQVCKWPSLLARR